MEFDLLIIGGHLIDPGFGFSKRADLGIAGGKIARVFEEGQLNKEEIKKYLGDRVIDAAGAIVATGFVDLHVHFREPGREDKETIMTGSRAAAAGGFTSVCCMPNTQPAIDNQETVKFVTSLAEKGDCRVYCIGAITKNRAGQELSEIGDLVKAGVVAISDDGDYVQNPEVMRRALEYARMFDIPVISHAEDVFLAAKGLMNESFQSAKLGMTGRPAVAEEIAIIRDIKLAGLTGGRLHIAHVSTAGGVEAIRRGKAEGVKVTAEATPHHFTLTDDLIGERFDTNLRVNPPLRTETDRQAVIAGLVDGTIDCIATDHAPHTDEEKDVEFDQAPPGMIGLETCLGLAVTELVDKGYLTLLDVIRKLSANPAAIVGLPSHGLGVGESADLVIFDPEAEWTVRREDFYSKSKNSPFVGRQLKGKVLATIMNGRVTHRTRT
ncbi:MAG: dihydroorotase [candidate division Zixibacteria bacterium]|nr:dihydroorotase [candidate division Zixibacteria bacterium]